MYAATVNVIYFLINWSKLTLLSGIFSFINTVQHSIVQQLHTVNVHWYNMNKCYTYRVWWASLMDYTL